MIRYTLCCDEGHRFESWFHDSLAFDEQAGRGLVSCPTCDSHHVAKTIMAPAIVAKRALTPVAPADLPATMEPSMSIPAPVNEGALLDSERRQLVKAIRDQVVAETRDVGRAFAAEARRIHHDDASKERIRGQATIAEARDLLEDGIMVVPLPALPDDLN